MNIIAGHVALDRVNVDDAFVIGDRMAAELHIPLKKKIITMDVAKKGLKIEDAFEYNMERLYARLLVLSQTRDISLQELFKYELSPVPASLFDDYGLTRKGNKSVMVNKLAVFASNDLENITLELVDGNEELYQRPWLKLGTVHDFANSFCKSFAKSHEVFVISDKSIYGSGL